VVSVSMEMPSRLLAAESFHGFGAYMVGGLFPARGRRKYVSGRGKTAIVP
jgi:hypothetical protein